MFILCDCRPVMGQKMKLTVNYLWLSGFLNISCLPQCWTSSSKNLSFRQYMKSCAHYCSLLSSFFNVILSSPGSGELGFWSQDWGWCQVWILSTIFWLTLEKKYLPLKTFSFLAVWDGYNNVFPKHQSTFLIEHDKKNQYWNFNAKSIYCKDISTSQINRILYR